MIRRVGRCLRRITLRSPFHSLAKPDCFHAGCELIPNCVQPRRLLPKTVHGHKVLIRLLMRREAKSSHNGKRIVAVA